jgi:hypothetical protein
VALEVGNVACGYGNAWQSPMPVLWTVVAPAALTVLRLPQPHPRPTVTLTSPEALTPVRACSGTTSEQPGEAFPRPVPAQAAEKCHFQQVPLETSWLRA